MAQPRASDVAKAMHLHYCWGGCVAGLMAVPSSADAASTSVGATPDEVESALTDRYQTTVPQPVRRALGLRKRDRIRYAFRANGEVVLQRVSPDPVEEDPALAPFLALLERDIASQPERLQPIGADLVQRLQDLVGAIEVNLDEALPDDEPA
jgi:antitoxin PrlF